MNDDSYELAAILATGDAGTLYSGLSVLVSSAVDGGRCAALASFGALALLTEAEPGAPAELARSFEELRATALDLDNLTIWACSASVQAMALDTALDGVMSTPRFLRETAGARRLIHV